jgi:hypothetical protein
MHTDKATSAFNQINDIISEERDNGYSKLISGIDLFNKTIYEPNMIHKGFVFVGRPNLNLTSSNLKEDRILSMINTTSPNTLAFAIRCYLDKEFAGRSDIIKNASVSTLVNNNLPYIPILSNMITSLSGWPDPTMETETTQGGFFSENITFAKGYDENRKTISLTLNFKDIQGGPIISLFTTWFRFIHLVLTGIINPYNKYINENKICYSAPIYRLVTDISGRYILYWSKATGTFPTSYPIGNYLNYNKTELTKDIGTELSIPFTCNFPEIQDPIILVDFNKWIKRTCPGITNMRKLQRSELLQNNCKAIPYIDLTSGKNELEWYVDEQDFQISTSEKLDNLRSSLSKNN